MLAVVRKPRTKTLIFEVKGEIPDDVLDLLKKGYTVDIENDEENLGKTDKKVAARSG